MVRGKRLIVFLLLFILVYAPLKAVGNKERVYDYANLLSQEEIEGLESLAEKYSRKRETDFIIVTRERTNRKDIVEYTEDFYDEMALGYDIPYGNTAIMVIDMEMREVYLAGFYKGETYLDNYRLDLIREKISPDLSKGNYYKAFKDFLKLGYKYMGIKPGMDPNSLIFSLGFQVLVSLGTAGLVVGFMLYNSGGRVDVRGDTYMDFSSSKVVNRWDRYIRTSVSKTRRPSQKSSSSRGGGGRGGGTSSGGHSHSGSRGRF